MRTAFVLLFVALMSLGCVQASTAVGYAQRAYPDCTNFSSLSHNYSGEGGSQTEVSMICDGKRRSVTVKCIYGMGLFSDTTCHENN